MDRALLGAHEARAHVDALGAERQCRDQAAAVAEAARGDHRNLHLVGGDRDQDQAGGIVLAGMAGALETVDRDRVDPHALRRQRVADAGAFVHDHDAVLLEFGDVFLRLVAGGLDDLDAALDDGLAIFRVGRRLDRGQDGEVDAERLVGQAAAARDFLGQILRRRLRQRGDEAERAGVGDGRDQFGAADPLHAALHDRVFDADEFGKSRFDHFWPSVPPVRAMRARSFM